ncbi:MAG: hypothetical protein IJO43_03565 [Bacilli bacterium]|nr:hypothetical protein [Bacilli bacterium]
MALTDCEKCWETPCVCGYEYKNNSRYSSPENMADYVIGILGYRSKEELQVILQILNEKVLEKINNQDEEFGIMKRK